MEAAAIGLQAALQGKLGGKQLSHAIESSQGLITSKSSRVSEIATKLITALEGIQELEEVDDDHVPRQDALVGWKVRYYFSPPGCWSNGLVAEYNHEKGRYLIEWQGLEHEHTHTRKFVSFFVLQDMLCPKMSKRQEDGAKEEDDMDIAIRKYFNRYDFDGSGT